MRKHVIVEGAIALVMFTLILMAVNVQVENSEDRVSFRLGPQDSTYEIIQELKYGETVESTIKNLDPSLTLEVVYIPVEESAKAMENGSIDWLYLVSIGEHYIVDAGDEILVKTDTFPKLIKEEYHLLELINLKVKILEKNELKTIGKVINLENEKNNLLVIELHKNKKQVLIPFVTEIVPLVDIKNNFLIINPPNGLLEL